MTKNKLTKFSEIGTFQHVVEPSILDLKKDISLEHFRKEVQRKNKAFEKSNDIHQVLIMFTRTASEILLRLLQELRSTEDYENIHVLGLSRLEANKVEYISKHCSLSEILY